MKSRRGCEAAAIFYTLCETAKLRGLNPHRYLQIAALRALEQPGAITLPEGVPDLPDVPSDLRFALP